MAESSSPEQEPIQPNIPENKVTSITQPITPDTTIKSHDISDTKALESIQGDLARFNLNLLGENEPWQPTSESGLPQAPEPVPSPELIRELENPIKVEDPHTGQKFNTLQVNWKEREEGSKGQRVIVFMPSYSSDIGTGPTHYRIQELARQNGMPILAVDHPSTGASDPLTDEQRHSLRGKEGYGKIAEAELRMMKSLGITEIDLVGQSMGAFAAAELAKQAIIYGIKVKNLILVETPGVENFSMLRMGKNFNDEGNYYDIYKIHPEDPQQIAMSGGPLTLTEKLKVGIKSLKPDSLKYIKAMSQKTIYTTTKDTLALNTDLQITVVNGNLSKVSPAEGNRELVSRLEEDGFKDRVRHIIFPGEPHVVMENAKRFGALTTSIISRSLPQTA